MSKNVFFGFFFSTIWWTWTVLFCVFCWQKAMWMMLCYYCVWVCVGVCVRERMCVYLMLSWSNVLSSLRWFKMWIVTPISTLLHCFYQVYIRNTIPLISFRGLKSCNDLNMNMNILQLNEDSGNGFLKKKKATLITLFMK